MRNGEKLQFQWRKKKLELVMSGLGRLDIVEMFDPPVLDILAIFGPLVLNISTMFNAILLDISSMSDLLVLDISTILCPLVPKMMEIKFFFKKRKCNLTKFIMLTTILATFLTVICFLMVTYNINSTINIQNEIDI